MNRRKPPRHWIEFAEKWRCCPMAFWVRSAVKGTGWYVAEEYASPAPSPVPHRGYAIYCVEIGRHVLRFSSVQQLAHCIEVLGSNPMPTPSRLSQLRGTSKGPNSHWLSRLPVELKSPRKRPRVADALRQAAASFRLQT